MNRNCLALIASFTVLITGRPSLAAPELEETVADIVAMTGFEGGFIVHLGVGDGQLTAELGRLPRCQVHGLDRSTDSVSLAREHLREAQLYGAVSVDRLSGNRLPYIDNLVNLVVASDLGRVDLDDVLRVLAPDGSAVVKEGDDWKTHRKPVPDTIDDWTHFLHSASGNAVAHDTEVGPPRHLQWLGSPRWSRHHDRMASMSALVSAAGRIFFIMDEGSRTSIQLPPDWKLVARDAFNGTILWKHDITKWHSHLWPLKSGPTQLARRLVASADHVFVTLAIDAPLTAISATTGEIVRTYEQTGSTEEIVHSDGTLFLLVNKGESELVNYVPLNAITGDQGDVNKNWRWDEKPRIVMAVDAESGETRWSRQTRVSPLTLCSDDERVYFHDGEKVVAVKRSSGDVVWSSEPSVRRRTITYNFGPRLVIHEDVVLYAGGERTMKAFAAATGKVLWEAPHDRSGYQSPEDLLVQQGLVWSAPTTSGKDSGAFTGRDFRTGEVKVEFPPDVDAYWFHHRCYIAKATDRFLIPSRTGIEFVDPSKEKWNLHHWVRGGCLYGVMPSNGLLYAPPHNCACYPEAKLYGFNALAPIAPTRNAPKKPNENGRLEKGSAFGSAADTAAVAEDWPTFRHDRQRSASTANTLPSELKESWTTELGGRLSSVTVANGKLFVSKIDEHTVYALDAETGQIAWTFTTGGRVDSPPTIEGGMAYFGSNDGSIYCVRASDGELAWRYRAAPVDRRLMAFEQIESAWPVHGSVLVQGGFVFGVAGRSNFLDGGLRFLKLDAKSGSNLAETIIDEKDPETGGNLAERHKVLQMPVGLPDILSSDGDSIFMKSQRMDQEGQRFEIGPNSADFAGQASVHAGKNSHLFAPMGFLDDTYFHRAYWVYGRSFAGGHAGYYQAGKFAPSGRILVFDDENVFGFGRKPQHLRWTTVLEHQLYSAPKEAPELPDSVGSRRGNTGSSSVRVEKSPKINPAGKSVFVEAWVFVEKPNGVVVAHGGPQNGYSLFVKNGRPQFAARVDAKLHQVRAKESVAGKWTHLAGALTSDHKVELYVNYRKAGSAEASGLIPAEPLQSIEIGSDEGSGVGEYKSPYGFTGIIDDVRVAHGDFGSADLSTHFDKDKPEGLPGKCELVVSCSFDNGKATDASGRGNHGTVVAAKPAKGKSGQGLKFTGRVQSGRAGGSLVKPHWTTDIPVFVRAMVKAGPNLIVCGPPDVFNEAETFERLKSRDTTVQKVLAKQDALLDGSEGAVLRVVSAADGSTVSSLEVKSLPIWDGMAAARGRLYLSTTDGTVVSFGARE